MNRLPLTLFMLASLATPALAQLDNAPRQNEMLNWGVATVLIICILVISVIRSKREHRD